MPDNGTYPDLRPCGAAAVDAVVDAVVCGHGEYCDQVAGHDGPHAGRPSVCTRPAGHDGPHIYATRRNARLYQWGGSNAR